MGSDGIRRARLLVILAPAIVVAQIPGNDFDATVNRAMDIWSSDHGTVLTVEARRDLLGEAHVAVTDTTQQYPGVSSADVARVVPSAVAAFLTETQNNATSATLSQLVQERVTGFGQVLPVLSDYPTLSVNVLPPAPPDFVVSINGVTYQAGSRLFRVKAGLTQIRISRAGHGGCDRNVTVTQSGPNAVSCQL